jgi:3-hydroxyacyl-CoA dehydrogenase/enoyl-CoA hydratase/3-hydroxybutyryl-CoA epimerase
VRWELDADRVMHVWFDAPEKSVNTLSVATWQGLDAAVREIETARPVGVIFASAKPRSFIVGADLFELQAMADAQLDEYLVRGQRILDRIAALPIPTVAAINGDALGGGLELALACRFRVAADDPRAKLGLPEITLGLVPGWGGTLRLPRLLGLEPALALLLAGKPIPPGEAQAIGLVDRIVPRVQLDAAATGLVLAPPAVRERKHDADPQERQATLDRCRADVRRRSGDHLPAPLRLVDIVETGFGEGLEAAAAAERRGLIDLRRTTATKHLLRLFFLRTAAKKAAAVEAAGRPRPVQRAVVIGGGTMGAGIAAALAAAGVDVQVVEADERAAAAAAARLAGPAGSTAVPVTTGWGAVVDAELVIEAVVEDLTAKRDVFRQLDRSARPDAVLASNTSSLSIASLAASVRDPARVIGLHFFNPVAKMPLVEVVRPPDAEPDAVATGVAVAALVGKTPVVCRDAPGFIVNRVLFPYLRESLLLAASGADIQQVDAAVRAWGMPMGPFALMDEIGLDVTRLIFESLEQFLGPQLAPPPLVAAMVARGWLGRKSGRGFYEHAPAAKPAPNPEWAKACGAAGVAQVVDEPLVERRLIGAMADEARLLFDEQIVASADAIDLATVLGIGFPAFRGGLATYAGVRAMPAT